MTQRTRDSRVLRNRVINLSLSTSGSGHQHPVAPNKVTPRRKSTSDLLITRTPPPNLHASVQDPAPRARGRPRKVQHTPVLASQSLDNPQATLSTGKTGNMALNNPDLGQLGSNGELLAEGASVSQAGATHPLEIREPLVHAQPGNGPNRQAIPVVQQNQGLANAIAPPPNGQQNPGYNPGVPPQDPTLQDILQFSYRNSRATKTRQHPNGVPKMATNRRRSIHGTT